MSSLTAEKEVLIILEKVEMENNQSIPLFFIKKTCYFILFYFILFYFYKSSNVCWLCNTNMTPVW